MRVYSLLPLVATLATAVVLREEKVLSGNALKDSTHDRLSEWKDKLSFYVEDAKDAIEDTFESVYDETEDAARSLRDYAQDEYSQTESWFRRFAQKQQHNAEAATDKVDEMSTQALDAIRQTTQQWYDDLGLAKGHPCPHHLDEETDDDEEHGNKRRRRPPHHHKPKLTVYQLIKKSKYTTKLAKLVDEFPDVVEKLNGSESHFTLFAPTDKAFEKIPHHGKKPSKEFLLKVLQYHVVPDLYPAKRVLGSNTLPTVLEGENLSRDPKTTPQRISVKLSLKGVVFNYYAPLVAANIAGTNGIIHGIGSILVPPPRAVDVVLALPGTFSTLELALWKTGLLEALGDTSTHYGGTVFAPNNPAWHRLGARANAFLFSKYGKKYLAALLKYHVAPNVTLYSDALYNGNKKESDDEAGAKRTYHLELPTLLGKSLSVDVAGWGRFVDIRINGFYHAGPRDGAVYDGVVHQVPYVLIPPKTPGKHADTSGDVQDISVAELRERLEPYVQQDGWYDAEDDDDDFDMASLEL